MINEIRAGLELNDVTTPTDANGDWSAYIVGKCGVTRIYVVEYPWVKVERKDEPPTLINLQHVESATLAVKP